MASIPEVCEFLLVPTPDEWLAQAPAHRDTLLIDHANCEKKAAGTALSLLYRYVDRPELLDKLSRLAREELLHFEQVMKHMRRLGVNYEHVSPSSYAAGMRTGVATHEPWRLVDTLIVGAVVEARSCERFYRLTSVFADELGEFYGRLLASEARHFQDYLDLAGLYAEEESQEAGAASIDDRVQRVLALDAQLVSAPAQEFRFHSGPLTQELAGECESAAS